MVLLFLAIASFGAGEGKEVPAKDPISDALRAAYFQAKAEVLEATQRQHDIEATIMAACATTGQVAALHAQTKQPICMPPAPPQESKPTVTATPASKETPKQ